MLTFGDAGIFLIYSRLDHSEIWDFLIFVTDRGIWDFICAFGQSSFVESGILYKRFVAKFLQKQGF